MFVFLSHTKDKCKSLMLVSLHFALPFMETRKLASYQLYYIETEAIFDVCWSKVYISFSDGDQIPVFESGVSSCFELQG